MLRINDASTIIQFSHEITEVSKEFDNGIERLFPEKIGYSKAKQKHSHAEIPLDRSIFHG